jgi:Flp pilus assembly protein TadG
MMRAHMFSRRKNYRYFGSRRFGAATVEMALVAPFIVLLTFGSIEFARMMMVRQALTNATREGCRHACLATTQDDNDSAMVVRERLQGVIRNYLNEDTIRVVFNPSFSETPAAQTRISTTVEVDCADVSWLPPVFYRGARIRVEASMYHE